MVSADYEAMLACLQERLQQEETPSDPYSSIKQVDTQRAEPEKIRVWREQQRIRLEEKGTAHLLALLRLVQAQIPMDMNVFHTYVLMEN